MKYTGTINEKESSFEEEKKIPKEEGKEYNREDKKEIKMVIWNVAGITENKKNELDYIKRFDIICLVETWIIKGKEE